MPPQGELTSFCQLGTLVPWKGSGMNRVLVRDHRLDFQEFSQKSLSPMTAVDECLFFDLPPLGDSQKEESLSSKESSVSLSGHYISRKIMKFRVFSGLIDKDWI